MAFLLLIALETIKSDWLKFTIRTLQSSLENKENNFYIRDKKKQKKACLIFCKGDIMTHCRYFMR